MHNSLLWWIIIQRPYQVHSTLQCGEQCSKQGICTNAMHHNDAEATKHCADVWSSKNIIQVNLPASDG